MAKKKSTPKRKNTVLFGFARKVRTESGHVKLKLVWPRVLGTLVALFLVAWLTCSTGLYAIYKYKRKYDEVEYKHMLFYFVPSVKEAHQVKLGDRMVSDALTAIEQGNFRLALFNLRSGVRLSPGNLEGRMYLTEFFQKSLGRPDMALSLLNEGLRHGGTEDLEYVKFYMQKLLEMREDTLLLERAEELIVDEGELNERNMIVALSAAQAANYRGNFDLAEDYLDRYQLYRTVPGRVLSAQISAERGQLTVAIDKLRRYIQQNPDQDAFYALITRYLREAEMLNQAKRYAILRTTVSPSPVARIDVIYCHHKLGDVELAKKEVDRYFNENKDDAYAMQLLANFATDSGDFDLARRIYENALNEDFELGTFALLFVEAYVVGGRYNEAIRFCEEIFREKPKWLENNLPVFNSLFAVAYYGAGEQEMANYYLQEFIGADSRSRTETLLAVAKRFRSLGGNAEARRILLAAYNKDAQNQSVVTALVEVELELGNSNAIGEYLRRLLNMRRPSVEVMAEAYRQLGSDRFIFMENRDELLSKLAEIITPSA